MVKTAIITTINDLWNWENNDDIYIYSALYVDGVDGEKVVKIWYNDESDDE